MITGFNRLPDTDLFSRWSYTEQPASHWLSFIFLKLNVECHRRVDSVILLWPGLLLAIVACSVILHCGFNCTTSTETYKSKILPHSQRNNLSLRCMTNATRLLSHSCVWSWDQIWWLAYLFSVLFYCCSMLPFFVSSVFHHSVFFCSLCSEFLHLARSHSCGLIWHCLLVLFNMFLRFPSDYFALVTKCWIKCLI